jgi:glycosyltransferase involved in cell wall biosynthesis/2-polyprenyl-3-methyl-5-hydroxy-6-metoxy-1,4-benzoquinol methylase
MGDLTMISTLRPLPPRAIATHRPKAAPLGLTYYGHVSDASGYGNAARGYIHALHSAGVNLSAVDLSGRARQVRDPLVESLLGKKIHSDFHLFHGIPHVWAQQAFRLSNTIAMTVWETDTMPSQWRNTLNHALEVWLPCDFNVEAFRGQLRKPVYKLPHAIVPRAASGLSDVNSFLQVTPEDFVVYSIFEWQDRKSPLEQVQAFLRAFAGNKRAVFVIKTNPNASGIARKTILEACQTVLSEARIQLRAEAWSESEVAALHGRGDCYLSLHRGEGWGYPIFEAACNGIPVVATSFSGPLEYLDHEHHQLVGCSPTAVRQPYMYYHPRMNWAFPDVADAAEKLRWVFDNADEARRKAQAVVPSLQERYSPEAIGRLARARLLNVLERTNPARWRELRLTETVESLVPVQPISSQWFDSDYFDHGIKSNWTCGYDWHHFRGLFQDTAAWLADMFPLASTFLDAGCAKGFLVRALRARNKTAHGFDFSEWAVQHADPDARPFMTLASTDDFSPDRSFDLLLAFDLLDRLTTDQVSSFLVRARRYVNTALVATINTGPPEAANRDLSRITCRSWWHDQFLSAGWVQDPVHRNLQHLCQAHALPARMKWEVFLYVPG